MDKKKIILVDQSMASQAALQSMFNQYDVLHANNFALMCEYLLEYRPSIVLVMFNCQTLEESQWMMMINKLKMFYPHTKIIAIADTLEDQNKVRGYAIDDVFFEQIVKEKIILESIERVLNKL